MKSYGITKAPRIHPGGNMNVCITCHGNPSNSCQDMLHKTSWWRMRNVRSPPQSLRIIQQTNIYHPHSHVASTTKTNRKCEWSSTNVKIVYCINKGSFVTYLLILRGFVATVEQLEVQVLVHLEEILKLILLGKRGRKKSV